MALTTQAPFPQGIIGKAVAVTAAAVVTTPTTPTNTVEIVSQAANPNGCFITKLWAIPTATNTADVLAYWTSADNGTTKYLVDQKLAAADTSSTTDAALKVDFGFTLDAPLELAANETLYVGMLVATPATIGWHFRVGGRAM